MVEIVDLYPGKSYINRVPMEGLHVPSQFDVIRCVLHSESEALMKGELFILPMAFLGAWGFLWWRKQRFAVMLIIFIGLFVIVTVLDSLFLR